MTTTMQRLRSTDTASLLRLGLIGLALLGIAGTAIERIFLEHWDGVTQQIVWPALLMRCLALLLIAWRPTPAMVWTARVLALAVLAVAGPGTRFHFEEDLNAGFLDRTYGDTWDRRTTIDQAWLAVTGQVAPAPTLAPGTLAEISLAILLASVRIPMADRRASWRGMARPADVRLTRPLRFLHRDMVGIASTRWYPIPWPNLMDEGGGSDPPPGRIADRPRRHEPYTA